MLTALHIRHYVLIDSLDIEFPEGLLIITGQTGAGKSILLGALSLAMGAKADPSVISEGADSCVVEAEFDAPSTIRPLFDENDLDWDCGHLIIRRVVHQARSRSFVNDVPVTAAFLTELSALLLDIHSQHQNLLLAQEDFQLNVLDTLAHTDQELQQYKADFAKYQHLYDVHGEKLHQKQLLVFRDLNNP